MTAGPEGSLPKTRQAMATTGTPMPDNSPTNEIDPGGLMSAPVPGNWSVNGGDQTDFASVIGQITGNSLSNGNTWAEGY